MYKKNSDSLKIKKWIINTHKIGDHIEVGSIKLQFPEIGTSIPGSLLNRLCSKEEVINLVDKTVSGVNVYELTDAFFAKYGHLKGKPMGRPKGKVTRKPESSSTIETISSDLMQLQELLFKTILKVEQLKYEIGDNNG